MNTMRFSLTAVAVIAVAVTLSACSSNDSISGTSPSNTPSASSSESSTDFNDSDVTFASGMVMHHEQAIEMSEVFLQKDGVDERVRVLAEKIKVAQEPEIDLMNEWLDSWGEPTESTDPMGGHDMGDMSGSMSEEDMNALADADGAEANSLFLTQMTAHHMGAIDMANSEIASGQNPDALELAEKIITAQTAEIEEMNDLLAAL